MSKKDKKVFSEPIKARYKHYYYDKFSRIATPKLSNVEVIEEATKRFKIRLLTSDVSGHERGDIMWADKASIIFPKTVDSDPWYNNL